MKHFRRHLLKTAVVVSALAIATMVLAQETKAENKPTTGAQKMKPTTLPGRPDMVIHCPDPAAQRIDFAIVKRTMELVNGKLRMSQYKGRVRITGVVKNVGKGAYESGPNQQGMYLYIGEKLLAKKDFGNLAPGQEATVTVEHDWDSASPSEGEFPPMYKLVIVYDPDISSDGNPKNDDCNGNNNVIQRSGADINALFKALR
jgi:hypothetical protein